MLPIETVQMEALFSALCAGSATQAPLPRPKRMLTIPVRYMYSIRPTGRTQVSASHHRIRFPDASPGPSADKWLPATDLPQTLTYLRPSLPPDVLPLPGSYTALLPIDTPFYCKDPFLHRSATLPSSSILVRTPSLLSSKTHIIPHMVMVPHTCCMGAGHSPPAIPLPPSASIRCRKDCRDNGFPLR